MTEEMLTSSRSQNLKMVLGNFLNSWSFPLFCVYLLMVVASRWVQTRFRPKPIRNILVCFNFACSLTSLITMALFIRGLLRSGSVFDMTPTDELRLPFLLYWLSKIAELLDTVFMIIRHKTRQITFLHVYHHSSMLLLGEYAYRFVPWPAISIFVSLNSFVHIVLYFYYGLSALRPNNPPTWRKLVTQLQIFQFVIGLIHFTYGYLFRGFCIYGVIYGISMTGLFMHFYKKAYMKTGTTKKHV